MHGLMHSSITRMLQIWQFLRLNTLTEQTDVLVYFKIWFKLGQTQNKERYQNEVKFKWNMGHHLKKRSGPKNNQWHRYIKKRRVSSVLRGSGWWWCSFCGSITHLIQNISMIAWAITMRRHRWWGGNRCLYSSLSHQMKKRKNQSATSRRCFLDSYE